MLTELGVGLLQTYLTLGLVFAVAFVTRGVQAIDPMAGGASWGFRLIIVPGTALLWPLLLLRWAAGASAPPTETNAHRRRARSTP
jgi:hypothetical protein